MDNHADSLDQPIPAYSLSVVKQELPIDERAAEQTISTLTPKMQSPAESSKSREHSDTGMLNITDQFDYLDFQQISFDFDALSSNYGEDWWQLDPTIFGPSELNGFAPQ